MGSADRPYGAVLVSQISQAIKRKGLIWPDNINYATLHITYHEEYMITCFRAYLEVASVNRYVYIYLFIYSICPSKTIDLSWHRYRSNEGRGYHWE